MRITAVETFIIHAPVTRQGIADSTHAVTHWGAPGVILHTDVGLTGYGYTGTHGHLASDRLITTCIREVFGPVLLGEDPRATQHLWRKLYHWPPVQWVGRAGITHLALGAIDIALWDLKAKAVQQPLWALLGGSAEKKLEAYNTDGGWLNWPLDVLLNDVQRLVEVEGYRGVKVKVGSPNPQTDLRRLAAVRNVIGPNIKLMIDANGRWDLPTAQQFGHNLAGLDITWFEEPLWYDDVPGHARLAASIATPIALGEQLYMLDDFRNFISAGAVHFVQPDCMRLAGVTQWWQAADLALAFNLPVCAHVGDMVQVHLQLSLAHPACRMLEYIPWLRPCFVEPAEVQEGYFQIPQAPGAGIDLREDALERFGQPS